MIPKISFDVPQQEETSEYSANFARLITKRWKSDSITSQLIELHWLPIKQRIDYKVLMLVYKALHNQAQSDITNMIQINVEWRHLWSSCSTLLFEPRTYCVTFGDCAFSSYALRIWINCRRTSKTVSLKHLRCSWKAISFRKCISNFLCLLALLNISLMILALYKWHLLIDWLNRKLAEATFWIFHWVILR